MLKFPHKWLVELNDEVTTFYIQKVKGQRGCGFTVFDTSLANIQHHNSETDER